MKIKQYEHLCCHTMAGKSERRMCWALIDDNGEFVDNFDYDTVHNKIRFNGSSKHYDYNDIPKAKQKIWKTNNLADYMFTETKI